MTSMGEKGFSWAESKEVDVSQTRSPLFTDRDEIGAGRTLYLRGSDHKIKARTFAN